MTQNTPAVEVTTDTFPNEVLEKSREMPVLVDFWADWCGPCKAIAPALEEISQEMLGSITIAKVDVDSNPSTPAKYGVRGIPTLTVFKNGAVEATKVGALSKSQLTAFLDSTI